MERLPTRGMTGRELAELFHVSDVRLKTKHGGISLLFTVERPLSTNLDQELFLHGNPDGWMLYEDRREGLKVLDVVIKYVHIQRGELTVQQLRAYCPVQGYADEDIGKMVSEYNTKE